MLFHINKIQNYFSKTESPVHLQNLAPIAHLWEVYPILLEQVQSSGNPNIKSYQDLTNRTTKIVTKKAIGAFQVANDLYEIIELPEAITPKEEIRMPFLSNFNKILLFSLSLVVFFIVILATVFR